MNHPFRSATTRLLLLLVIICNNVIAQPVPQTDTTSLFKGMNWRNVGPNRGGRSLGIAGSSKRKLEYYFGAVGGGLWKTTDGGLNWKPVTDAQITSSSVGAVAVSES
ncbi:MAG: glycosyl, partial [Chitinophagaceae bacterium]